MSEACSALVITSRTSICKDIFHINIETYSGIHQVYTIAGVLDVTGCTVADPQNCKMMTPPGGNLRLIPRDRTRVHNKR